MKQISLGSRLPSLVVRAAGLLLGGSVLALAQQYTVTTVAGGAPPATPAAPLSVSIGPPQRVATDAAGNVYFTSLNSVFKLDTSGVLTLVAGTSRAGFSGDGGPATQAQLDTPAGLAIDASGDVFIADTANNRIREVTPDGNIHTYAGTGQGGFYGNFGPATQALLQAPGGVAVDSSGNLYIADSGNHQIRRVTPAGIISPFAGNAFAGFNGDAGPATAANLYDPQDVAVGPKGLIYIADTGNSCVRAVGTDGNINTVAGSNSSIGFTGDNGAATSASLTEPYAVTADASGNYYIADAGNFDIRMVNTKGIITTFAGNLNQGFAGDGGPAPNAELNVPTGVAVDGSGNVYIADQWNLRIRKVSSGNINTVAGNGQFSYSGDGGPAAQAQLYNPQGVAVDTAGNLYIADSRNAQVRKVASGGIISTIAGTSLSFPRGLAADSAGNVYVADFKANRVKKIALDGTVTTIAGSGTAGFSGDGGAATSAQFNGPFGVAVDSSGNVYVADFGNNRVRQIAPSGTIATVAGGGAQAYFGDGGPAAQAGLNGPMGVAVDSAGNLYIADSNNNAVREVTTDGVIHTIAGTGVAGYTGDGGPPTQAQIIGPAAIAVDSAGNVYIADSAQRLRKIYPGSLIATIAGDGASGYSGDNGPALQATFNGPAGIAADASGNLYVADSGNNAVRRLQPAALTVSLNGVTNGASNLTGPVAPGEVVVLYGSGLGPAKLTVNQNLVNGGLTTSLGGTTVFFNGIPAPLIYTSQTQVAAVVPFGASGSNVVVSVAYQNQPVPPVTVPLAAAAPALFTLNYSGKGQAVALNANATVNAAANPAATGSQLMLFATGIGQTSPAGSDGVIASEPVPSAAQAVTVTIGGQTANVVSATDIAGVVEGVMQITVQIPSGVQAGSAVPVTLQVGGVSAPSGVTVAVSQ